MAKWFAQLTLAVLTGVLIYWLTQGADKPPDPALPTPALVVGYLVVPDNGPILALGDLGVGATICGSKSTIESLRAFAPLSRQNLRVLPAVELFQGYQVGLCKGVLFRNFGDVSTIFPADLAGGRVIELRE
ncbi:MAG: hypothetical protein LJE68_09865 [Rhodobacter sp.]|nr:hypothetical protein [Rhodobacter sp.]